MSFVVQEPYKPHHAVRIVTATSLFDGHDAAINIMRRIMQSTGAEVIHLGHNRSAQEIVECAIEEDAQGIAITSYQGGHLEFFKYIHDLLDERDAGHVRVFGGGGGTILPDEIAELHAYGIARIYSPDDGRAMGLQGMINDVLRLCDFSLVDASVMTESNEAPAGIEQMLGTLSPAQPQILARLITICENNYPEAEKIKPLLDGVKGAPVLGITGTGGAGKSSLVDELARRFVEANPEARLAILSVDPSRRKSGGALLGDRIRMNAISHPHIYMRSMATRQSNLSLSSHVGEAIALMRQAGYDLVIVETSGIGQSDTQITDYADVTLYVMTPEYGAATQLEKIDMLDFADVVCINKFDKKGALDSLRDVRKQYRRNRNHWDGTDEELPILGTRASQFNDPGMDDAYERLRRILADRTGLSLSQLAPRQTAPSQTLIPSTRLNYLLEIVDAHRRYEEYVDRQCLLARQAGQLAGAAEAIEQTLPEGSSAPEYVAELRRHAEDLYGQMDGQARQLLDHFPVLQEQYSKDELVYVVRGKEIRQPFRYETLSGLKMARVSLPRYQDAGDRLRWLLTQNIPGEFPYSGGVFPLKREGEDPTRMFAGEGPGERTNRRFHYVSLGMPAKRLSTAFDSVTLYGEDPAERPDIYGKIGNSGVSISTVDDAKRLYSGFDLCDPKTSVSMTINGPAPVLLAFFLNAAIDQQVEKHLRQTGTLNEALRKRESKYKELGMPVPTYQGELPEGNDGLGLALLGMSGDEVVSPDVYAAMKKTALEAVRGTVQADILKEDQAQNTCIFSPEFGLRMMGDIQQYFIDWRVRNFYSVSISGYHIAEAGANPITQLAFTLANGFTYVEYYLSRGMKIDDFVPNLSFFFSNGVDAEYSVIGRVARQIWAKAIKHRYGGNSRSQKLKYHIQTSGRSLHAQEIAFNDIRTTLQALYAIYDNCNSLHTNAYDEAITTPTEESVRRAMAIQLIINNELGLARSDNPMQGSFIIDELSDLVEQAVMHEFVAINERGGVLGAMERMYQRNKIQDESLYYETLKHEGKLPIIGVNTFLDRKGSPTITPAEVIRSSEEEKRYCIAENEAFRRRRPHASQEALEHLTRTARDGENTFEALMEAVKVSTLGQISQVLYQVGGQYRRNM